MSASVKKYDPVRRYAEFFIDEEADLAVLPTINGAGTDAFSTFEDGISQGSVAFLTNTDATYYRLRGTGSWAKIESSGGGGGGQVDYNTQVYNKPTINGNTVQGDITSDDIDVAPEPTVVGENLVI